MKYILLKTLFILSLSFIALSVSSEISSQQQAEMQKMEREKASYVQELQNQLDSCRSKCQAQHTKKTNQMCGADYCSRAYTNEECDQEFCYTQKLNYDNHKRALDNMLAAREQHENLTQGQEEAPLEQVQKQKKETNILAYVGAGTTAFLGYRATTCCAKKPPCAQCATLLGMTALAGRQTTKMFSKKDELGATAQALCARVDDPSCSFYKDQNGDKEEIPIMPPGCQQVPSEICETVISQFETPPPGECPPEDPNCLSSENPNAPNMPGRDPVSRLTGDTRFTDAFKPKEGWPNGINPFADIDSSTFDYDKFTPSQKKQAKQIMAGLNKKNKAFLDKHGLSGDSNSGDESETVSGAIKKEANKDSGEVSAKFDSGGTDESSRSLSGDSPTISASPKTKSIAEQMKDMLKKLHERGGNSKGVGFLGDKSVLVGNDNVGVREDNIFMMVHRMNRKLDEKEQRFIKSISF